MGYTPPEEIDIGVEAIDRPDTFGETHTVINKNNPANASGKITSIEIYTSWSHDEESVVKVATFFVVSGNNLSTRDYEIIGTLTASTKHVKEVNLDVEEGDYIGIYGCDIERTLGVAETLWGKLNSDEIPCENVAFNSYGDVISLYGTGTGSQGELTIGEAFSIADSLVKNAIEQLSEAFSIADSLIKNVTKQLVEAFLIADSKVTKISKSLEETFSIVDSFKHTIILHFYEILSIKDSFTTYLKSLWHKVTKAVTDCTKVEKETDDWTKVEKEKGTCTKVDKTDVGWLASGWLIYGWLIELWGKVSKLTNGWNKVNKEE